ncbi:MAG: efflux RND transporter permease subunit, partial [Thermoguttaceae bacterium]|nr:efflux RND transporter permease subunit [Thermoguttaceae bacterium]
LTLPAEAMAPIVIDDFGDVYGIVIALSSNDYPASELRDKAKLLQKELQLVNQVGRVELWGDQKEIIEIEVSRAKMAELAVPPAALVLALQSQNAKMSAGEMVVDGETIRLAPQGVFGSVEEIEDLILPDTVSNQVEKQAAQLLKDSELAGLAQTISTKNQAGSKQIRLRDIATVKKVYEDPAEKILRVNGVPSVALGIAPVPGGNVIEMGDGVRKKSAEILKTFPVGFELQTIAYQPDNVRSSINAFMKNLYEAVIIVTIVVMVAMGWRSGLLITSSLLVVILATMCVIYPMGMTLHRVSLGAFIVALGILVDDAVVVGDLILVRMQQGMERKEACIEGASRVAHQLLGATIVGFIAFLPVYLSQDMSGEYCCDLFLVLTISLIISWLVAMLQTPVVYYKFVKHVAPAAGGSPHGGLVYRGYRAALEWSLRHKIIVLLGIGMLLALSIIEFRHVEQIFFPRAVRTQFMVDYWLPEGTSINQTSEDAKKIEEHLKSQTGVKNVAAFIGSGPPRFYLPYEPELPNSSYAHFVVNVDTLKDVDNLLDPTSEWLQKEFPQAFTRAQKYCLGPTTKFEVEVRLRGPNEKTLRHLASQVESIMRKNPHTHTPQPNWRQPTLAWTPNYSQPKGSRAGVSRTEMGVMLRWASAGIPVGQFAEGDNILPIVVRGTEAERNDIANLDSLPIWGRGMESVPLGQITSNNQYVWEERQIHRRDRVPTLTVGVDPKEIQWTQLVNELKPEIDKIELPEGYTIEWGGQLEKSQKAQAEVLKKEPIALIIMAIIVVALFNGMRQPIIIAITFPLAMIGITFGLLVMHQAFGFMALVGAMSLLGMMVRNGVVLMDQIDEERHKGMDVYHAIVEAAVERLRPVTVAAMTVIVGMIPLLQDTLFSSMATAIMFGLIIATFLTLFVVPVFYMILFRAKIPAEE